MTDQDKEDMCERYISFKREKDFIKRVLFEYVNKHTNKIDSINELDKDEARMFTYYDMQVFGKMVFEKSIVGFDNDLLTAEHLTTVHNISIYEAYNLLDFCESKAISDKRSYGDGSIIFPMWIETLK